MSRKDQIILALEKDMGIELDPNWDESILCDDIGCRHSECDCWSEFSEAVEAQLEKQLAEQAIDSMHKFNLEFYENNKAIYERKPFAQDLGSAALMTTSVLTAGAFLGYFVVAVLGAI